ncbi:retrovirus-related Pol polyprotein [Pseudoscourfieldia marina]
MPELDNSKPPLFVPSKRSYNDFVLAWRGHSRKRNYSQLLEWAENPDNAPEALTQQQQTWNSRFFSDLVDSCITEKPMTAATAALAAMDAAADDGMQLWTALKREIDITLPSARSHAEDQLKTKTKQKHDETVAEFGLRFRGAKTADAALHYPCKGAAVAVTAAARVAEEAATPNVSTRSDTTDAAKMQTVQLHTLTTLRCVMRLAARVTTQHVGAATPTQAAEVAVDEADIKVAEADEEDDTRCTTDASHHGIGGTQQYLPPPPPLPSQLMQNNIARYIVDNASPYTLTGSLNHLYDVQQLEKPKEIGGIKKDSTIKCTHVGKIDFTTHEGTLTVSNAYYGFYFGQIDVETAYLYALVQELIYMRPPKGTNYGPNKICRLLKSLYGLKQAGRNWYLDLKDYLVELGFKPGEVDIGMYSVAVGTENEIWILVYVDDIIFASKNEQTKDIFAGHLRKKYRITEPAQLTWALGMKVSFAADGIILTQDLYMKKTPRRVTSPGQFVGAILYAAVISRPDLSSTVRVMSHVMSKPPSNFEACKKHVLRYLSGTINRGIKYNTNSNVPLKLIGYCDASSGDNHENRRSTSGYIFFLNGGPISWASYLQTTVALSTVESEVMALTEAIKEAIYIRRLLESLGAAQEGPTIIYTDSTGAEALVDHPTSHRRTKHIEIRREFIKYHIEHETVKIERVSTKDQLADIMTKPLRQDIHNYLVQMILHG